MVTLIGLLPVFFIPAPWVTVTQGKVLLAATLLLAAGVVHIGARVMAGTLRVPRSFVLLIACALPLVYLVSAAFSGLASISILGYGVEPDTLAMVTLAAGALIVAASIFSADVSGITRALRSFILGNLALALIGLIHVLVPSFTFGGVIAGETANAFGGWHEYGMMLGAALIMNLALLRTTVADGAWRYVLVASALIAFLHLIIINYIDVWASVAISLIVLALVHAYRLRPFSMLKLIRREWFIALVAGVAIALCFFGTSLVATLPESVSVAQLEVRPSWQGTYAIGRQSLNHPTAFLFGAGPNTFVHEWGVHKPVEVNQTPFWNADFNVGAASIPTSFITVGLLGTLAWLAFIGSVLWMMLRIWIAPAARPLSDEVIAISIVVASLLAMHLLSIPGTAVTLLMFALLGVLIARDSHERDAYKTMTFSGGGWQDWNTVIGTSAIGIILVFAAVGLIRVNASEVLVNRAIVSYNTMQDGQKASRHIASALRIYSANDRAHRVAVEIGLAQLRSLAASPDAAQEAARTNLQQTLERTIQHGLNAVSINGADRQNWLGLAAIYAELVGSKVEGAYESARTAYERALAADPSNPLPLLNLGRLEMMQNKPDEALRYFTEAAKLKPDFAAAYYFASQVLAAKNDLRNAQATATKAAEYASADPEAWYNLGAIAYTGADYKTSTAALEQAVTLQPQFANALYILGLSYYAEGNTQRSITAFEALDRLDPGQEIVAKILANLRSGNGPFDEVATVAE